MTLVDCAFEPRFADAAALLTRYHSLVGWAEGLLHAGASAVTVVHRFHTAGIVRRHGVTYHFVADGGAPFPSSRFVGARVARVVRASEPSVVHCDGLIFPALVRNLARLLPPEAAILVQDHGGMHEGAQVFHTWLRRQLFRWGLAGADGFLFTHGQQAAPWRRAGILGGAQAIYEVPEGSTDLATRSGASPLGRSLSGSPAFLWVGKLDANKDPLTVLAGFEVAARALPGAALTMVFGEDALLAQVRARIAGSAWLEGRVHLRGRLEREALGPLYASADVFVLGSHHEGAGYALLEALAFGVTPVVTDIPPFRVLTDGGRLGALFPPGDARELGEALVRVGRSDLAARRAQVRAHFDRALSWDAIGRKAVAIYREAVASRNAARQRLSLFGSRR